MRKSRPDPKALATFCQFLHKRGLRFTSDRRSIIRAVFDNHNHFSMDDLFVALRLKGQRVSKTTLYRNLPLLVESGLIRRVSDDSPNSRFEHILGHPHHDHLICLSCGREMEFASNEIEAAQERVCEQYGFQPVRHRLGIWGYCGECSSRKARKKAARRRK